MADTTGQTPSPIISDLLHNGHEFSFPQVMRLARTVLGSGGEYELPEIPWQERVRVRPDLSFAFPAADVARIEQDGSDLQVTATFLGLYGSSSPLPAFYTEDLMDEASNDSSVSRDFLDILHQRLYQLYFACWSKYRIFIRMEEEKNLLDRERLFCLIGLGEKELRDSVPDAWSLVRYAGLLTQFPRSAEGLQTLLRDSLGVSRLEVEQCVLRKVPIPVDQRMSLGISGMRLGVDTVLGSEIADRMGKFRILVGPLKKKEFDSFLPGTPQHNKLLGLIRLYVLDPFDFDLKVTLAAGEARPITLGDAAGPRLGWNTWCFSGETLGAVSTIFSPAHSKAKAPAPAEDECDDTPESTEPPTLLDYYKKELALLRDLANDYIKIHPDMAPLVSGHMADSGVERLLEGTAFLNAHLRMKIEDDFPEVIHNVIHAIQPNYLRPIPATTIIAFTPKANCTEPHLIPVGTELKSIPVDGTECRFTTSYPVEIHPLALTNASFAQPPGKPAAITLNLKLTGCALKDWQLNSLRLFLAGEHKDALNLYLVLMRYLKRIVIAPAQGGQPVILGAEQLKAVGFEDTDLLFPNDASGSTSQQVLHEYFIQPDKFLFIDLHGWEKWRERGDGTEFEIRFELDMLPFALHQVSKADFTLFATPAVNLFRHQAEPITIKESIARYPILPFGGNNRHYAVHSIKGVTGLVDKISEKIQFISSQCNPQSSLAPVFQVTRSRSHAHEGVDTFVSVEAPPKFKLQNMGLYVDLLCSNGNLPEKLQAGDICKNTDNSPEIAGFANCKPVKRSAQVNPRNGCLWMLYSLCNLNLASFDAKSLRAVLDTASQAYDSDYMTTKNHSDRIKGLTELQIKAIDRVYGKSMLRGWEIRFVLNHESFDSPGEQYLFGALLEHFLSGFATQSSFTKTTAEVLQDGKKYEWPMKMGRRALV
ncbi:MAG: hypothetical protein CXR30_11995 [Geobacter sp.]|nr:MAG: hypothetical protein CXR30_11995 [Geobacter sp.]